MGKSILYGLPVMAGGELATGWIPRILSWFEKPVLGVRVGYAAPLLEYTFYFVHRTDVIVCTYRYRYRARIATAAMPISHTLRDRQ